MSVTAYVTYSLFNYDGAGIQPYHQVNQCGMEFDGGHFFLNGRMLGYIKGDTSKLEKTLSSLVPWAIDELTAVEAMAWSELSLPVNHSYVMPNETTMYVGPASLDDGGYIVRPVSDTEW